jgi:hypothetical protein
MWLLHTEYLRRSAELSDSLVCVGQLLSQFRNLDQYFVIKPVRINLIAALIGGATHRAIQLCQDCNDGSGQGGHDSAGFVSDPSGGLARR